MNQESMLRLALEVQMDRERRRRTQQTLRMMAYFLAFPWREGQDALDRRDAAVRYAEQAERR